MGEGRRTSNRISPSFHYSFLNLEDEILVKGVGFVIPKNVNTENRDELKIL
jgi:hypothetical protein